MSTLRFLLFTLMPCQLRFRFTHRVSILIWQHNGFCFGDTHQSLPDKSCFLLNQKAIKFILSVNRIDCWYSNLNKTQSDLVIQLEKTGMAAQRQQKKELNNWCCRRKEYFTWSQQWCREDTVWRQNNFFTACKIVKYQVKLLEWLLPVLTVVFYVSCQVEWRDEVRHHFEKIKSEGTCLHRLDEELIKRRREELRWANRSETMWWTKR